MSSENQFGLTLTLLSEDMSHKDDFMFSRVYLPLSVQITYWQVQQLSDSQRDHQAGSQVHDDQHTPGRTGEMIIKLYMFTFYQQF